MDCLPSTLLVKYVNFIITLFTLALAILMVVNLIVSRQNTDLTAKLNNLQQVLSGEKNTESALRTLTVRIAQGAEKDPALRDLLVKYQLRATIEVNGQQKEVP